MISEFVAWSPIGENIGITFSNPSVLAANILFNKNSILAWISFLIAHIVRQLRIHHLFNKKLSQRSLPPSYTYMAIVINRS